MRDTTPDDDDDDDDDDLLDGGLREVMSLAPMGLAAIGITFTGITIATLVNLAQEQCALGPTIIFEAGTRRIPTTSPRTCARSAPTRTLPRRLCATRRRRARVGSRRWRRRPLLGSWRSSSVHGRRLQEADQGSIGPVREPTFPSFVNCDIRRLRLFVLHRASRQPPSGPTI